MVVLAMGSAAVTSSLAGADIVIVASFLNTFSIQPHFFA